MTTHSTSELLRAELKALADTLEEVLDSSTDKPKAEWDKLRAQAQHILQSSREHLKDASEKVTIQTKEIAGHADNYVRENPWAGVGIGAAVGLVLGVLLARR